MHQYKQHRSLPMQRISLERHRYQTAALRCCFRGAILREAHWPIRGWNRNETILFSTRSGKLLRLCESTGWQVDLPNLHLQLHRRRMQSSGHLETKYRIDVITWFIRRVQIIFHVVNILLLDKIFSKRTLCAFRINVKLVS